MIVRNRYIRETEEMAGQDGGESEGRVKWRNLGMRKGFNLFYLYFILSNLVKIEEIVITVYISYFAL